MYQTADASNPEEHARICYASACSIIHSKRILQHDALQVYVNREELLLFTYEYDTICVSSRATTFLAPSYY